MRQYRSTVWGIAFFTAALLAGPGYFARIVRAEDAALPTPAPVAQPAAPAPPANADDSSPPATPSQEQPEALTRGPVNEAFAEPVDTQPQAGVVATTQPPEPIQETPPSDKPQGGRYVWVPGYWGWDSDRKDYIWVSGCWRAAPPHMYWVPGYWAQTNGGWEWIAGFWAPDTDKEIQYLPAPPQDVDAAAPGEPPTPDQVWVPPCYYWNQDQYVLRPGYWLGAQVGWCWTPSHYVWTPRGYCFAAGYWDYSLDRRGVLFAPVFFSSRHFRAGFAFSPSVALDLGAISVNFFAYPRYCHYYFGDYYDDGYLSLGIYPWFDCERFHTWYDPIFVYDRWHFGRNDPHWIDRVHHDYDIRHADVRLRPARTFREQEARVAHLPENQRAGQRIGEPFRDVMANKNSAMKYEKVNAATRDKITHQTADALKYRQERAQWERPSATSAVRSEHQEAPLPNEHRENNATPTEHREAPSPTEEHREPTFARPAVTREPTYSAPHESRVTEPEHVQIRQGPIMGESEGAGTEREMPARPSGEMRSSDGGGGGGGEGRGGGGGGNGGHR